MRHARFGHPRAVIDAAIAALAAAGLAVESVSPTIASAPIGPSRRRYANAAAIVATDLAPEALLGRLQAIEHAFGRRRRGAQWSARVLDLDIILWSGGAYVGERAGGSLVIPHPAFRERDFVLGPAMTIAAGWRDPLSRLTVRQLAARHARPGPAERLTRAASLP